MIMATYKEVMDYAVKHELWTPEHIEKYTTRVNEATKKNLNIVYGTEANYIMGNVGNLCDRITRNLTSIYFDYCHKEKESNNDFLCAIVSLFEITLACDYFDIRDDRDAYSEVLSRLSERWLMLFACNRFDLAQYCYPTLINGLQNGMLCRSLPRSRKPQRLGVLAMEMMAREHKQTISWDEADIPVDPFYQRFCDDALLSADNDLVRDWLVGLCDKHLEWADLNDEKHDRSYITGYEIQRGVLLLWPFEYQAVKNYRARHGLTTPEIDHPLLTGPMAMEHIPDFASWQRWDWFDPLLDFVAEKKPELAFLKTLFN
ncbi:hypothetical protein [Klebsiella michiganensis]|uniref:hypothetical protein n=1 Tax=Klebsiella michiganensis TaxID=1134687 RepID=UPI003888C9FF